MFFLMCGGRTADGEATAVMERTNQGLTGIVGTILTSDFNISLASSSATDRHLVAISRVSGRPWHGGEEGGGPSSPTRAY